jgi:hypothetical protein
MVFIAKLTFIELGVGWKNPQRVGFPLKNMD